MTNHPRQRVQSPFDCALALMVPCVRCSLAQLTSLTDEVCRLRGVQTAVLARPHVQHEARRLLYYETLKHVSQHTDSPSWRGQQAMPPDEQRSSRSPQPSQPPSPPIGSPPVRPASSPRAAMVQRAHSSAAGVEMTRARVRARGGARRA
jgi:hypothetical protein